ERARVRGALFAPPATEPPNNAVDAQSTGTSPACSGSSRAKGVTGALGDRPRRRNAPVASTPAGIVSMVAGSLQRAMEAHHDAPLVAPRDRRECTPVAVLQPARDAPATS